MQGVRFAANGVMQRAVARGAGKDGKESLRAGGEGMMEESVKKGVFIGRPRDEVSKENDSGNKSMKSGLIYVINSHGGSRDFTGTWVEKRQLLP